ncbi:MAG TPA: hypothetical protein PKB03_08065, partial [Baekduia sp.]|nr:hypothetical protein [Baekduia sp.]
MAAPIARHHAEWLQLIDVSGPFLALPILAQAFPQGLEPDEPGMAKQVGVALEELAVEPGLRATWVRWVLTDVLGWPVELLREHTEIPASARHDMPEHGVYLAPDVLLTNPDDATPRLHVCVWPAEQSLDARNADSSWNASPRERGAELCRATGVPLALVTNGRSWTLVHARAGETVGYATWDAELWLDERLTLRAFRTLLGVGRLLGAPDDETLEALLLRSDDAQQEVTDQLGTQVRHAVELLVSELDRADEDAGGTLLVEVSNHSVYEAAVAVMMRLVFCFFAEEHDLLPLSGPRYADRYAASTLRAQLQEEADQAGEDTLDARASAWHRLLALFRAVHAGIAHDELRLPAYGGALFDPDRFPFLEGRDAGSTWLNTPARPLPISDRTVLHVLSALQILTLVSGRGRGEPQRLSYRALDVEQIGHVYEGLLDHDAIRIDSPALGFAGSREEEIALALVEQQQRDAESETFVAWLAKQTGLSESKVRKGLDADLDAQSRSRLRAACGNDDQLAQRALPYLGLLREDLRALPVVYRAGGIYVTKALERRSSGSYYTPRALAEDVVRHALEPIVYAPGPADAADPANWRVKAPQELLELNVCDMAMGSGAFLVGACRYLAERLVEAWSSLGEGSFTVLGEPSDLQPEETRVPSEPEDRNTLARRLVADRCLYGVDINPMAVDMAKLSLWLITMAKDRPFSFLDHALRTGDSLLGITALRQLEFLHLDPARGNRLHGRLVLKPEAVAQAIDEARARRVELESMPVFDPTDAEQKAALLQEADHATERVSLLADALVAAAMSNARNGHDALDIDLSVLAEKVPALLAGDAAISEDVTRATARRLRTDAPTPTTHRRPFHWPLAFPEV